MAMTCHNSLSPFAWGAYGESYLAELAELAD
jgi:hypothetical protein